MKIKGRTHTYHHSIHATAMSRHPAFLLGTTQTDKHNAGTAVVDPSNGSCVLFGSELTKRWGLHRELQIRECSGQVLTQ